MTQQQRTQAAIGELKTIETLLQGKGEKYDRDVIIEIGPARVLAQLTIKAIRAEACTCPKDTMAELDDVMAYAALAKSLIKELSVTTKEGP